MKYNPNIHHRQSIRLKGYDYSKPGLYFITICCGNRKARFGTIAAEKMQLNEFGRVAHDEWLRLPARFENCELHEFQVMPNHMHGIIQLIDIPITVALSDDDDQPNDFRAGASPAPTSVAPTTVPTVSDIVGAYKSIVSVECLKIYKTRDMIMGKLWQRDYHEHVIRDQRSYDNISKYIVNNPSRWYSDKFYAQ